MVSKTTVTREQIARPVIDLVEQFGFEWEEVHEYPLPDVTQRIQIRTEKHYAPAAKVREIRAALERGERLPPIVVTKMAPQADIAATDPAGLQRAHYTHSPGTEHPPARVLVPPAQQVL